MKACQKESIVTFDTTDQKSVGNRNGPHHFIWNYKAIHLSFLLGSDLLVTTYSCINKYLKDNYFYCSINVENNLIKILVNSFNFFY
jgi:hypothetical protein